MLPFSVLVYDLFIRLYEFGAYLLSFQNEKAAKWYSGRKDIFTKIEKAFAGYDDSEVERIWMHCASLGEFEQGRPVLESLRKEKLDAIILLTFFSPSGYEMRKNYPNADMVFYLPLDTRSNAKMFLQLVKPGTVIFVKYEFWYHYFMAIKKSGSRFILISGIFRKNQAFFRWYGGFYRKMLKALSHIFVQDDNSMILLNKIGLKNVTRANDTRIDRVISISASAKTLPTLELFLGGTKALVCGSIYDIENELIHKACLEGLISEKIIIAPHQVDPDHINKIMEPWAEDAILYSEFNERDAIGKRAIIVDSMGMLSNIYKYANMAIIGGGFGKGIHNTLEPAAFGIPILFGPNYSKFKEAIDMLDTSASFSFTDYESLKEILLQMHDEAARIAAGKEALKFIETHSGGTQKIMDWLGSVNS
jgi:3-deoxy-D-manno-octulosonic-acid transferase